MTISHQRSYDDLRIYFDGILHLLIPVGESRLCIQAYVDKKLFFIEIGTLTYVVYEKKETWISVLKILNDCL